MVLSKRARSGLCLAGLAAAIGLAACSSRSTEAPASKSSPTSGASIAEDARVKASKTTGGPERMVLRLIHDQDLTPAQELKLMSLRRGLLARWEGLHQELHALEPAVRAELTKPSPDAATAQSLTDKGLALHAALAHAVTDEALAFLATLTDEQRQLVVSRARLGTLGVPDRADVQAAAQAVSFARTNGASTAVAESPTPGADRPTPGDLSLRALEAAALTTPQRHVEKNARHALRASHEAVDAAVEAETETLLTELAKPAPDAAAIHAAVDRVLAVSARGAHTVTDGALAVSTVMTHEQKLSLAR